MCPARNSDSCDRNMGNRTINIATIVIAETQGEAVAFPSSRLTEVKSRPVSFSAGSCRRTPGVLTGHRASSLPASGSLVPPRTQSLSHLGVSQTPVCLTTADITSSHYVPGDCKFVFWSWGRVRVLGWLHSSLLLASGGRTHG